MGEFKTYVAEQQHNFQINHSVTKELDYRIGDFKTYITEKQSNCHIYHGQSEQIDY